MTENSEIKHKPDISKANVCPPLPANATVLDKAVYWLAIGLGSGLPQKAPGTWGTLGGMVVAIPLIMLGFIPFLIITIIASIVGIWICGRASELMNVHDDPHIVFDEWAGVWIAMLPIAFDFSYAEYSCFTYSAGGYVCNQQLYDNLIIGVVAFVLFRFFDIIKPFPISYLDKNLTGGLGIMLDDLLAGIIPCIIIIVLMFNHIL